VTDSDCYVKLDPEAMALLRSVNERLKKLEFLEEKLEADIDDILSDLQDETNTETAVITLLTSIDVQLKAAGNDPVKVAAVRALIASNKAALAAAIVANTPADPNAPAAGATS
jgi:transcription initiation factor TFIIIB Brf1 subunit/transcription initiation factor TFIIB